MHIVGYNCFQSSMHPNHSGLYEKSRYTLATNKKNDAGVQGAGPLAGVARRQRPLA